jgi:hypothetical protein
MNKKRKVKRNQPVAQQTALKSINPNVKNEKSRNNFIGNKSKLLLQT